MTARIVQQSTNITIRAHVGFELFFIEKLQARVAMGFPQRFLCFKLRELALATSCEDTAWLQIAFNIVLFNKSTNDTTALKGHLAHLCAGVFAVMFLYEINITAVAVNDLPAITARCAEAYCAAFQDDNLVAIFREVQGGRHTGVTGADNANICFNIFLKRRSHPCVISGSCIVGIGVRGCQQGVAPGMALSYWAVTTTLRARYERLYTPQGIFCKKKAPEGAKGTSDRLVTASAKCGKTRVENVHTLINQRITDRQRR